MAARCLECNGCMKIKGNYSRLNENGETSSLLRWFCKFCTRYFVREGLGVPLEEVLGNNDSIGKRSLRGLSAKG